MAASLLRRSAGASVSQARRVSRSRRHFRIRRRVSGTPSRPRLVVTRSSRHISAQVIDDLAGHTLASASTMEASLRSGEGKVAGNKTDAATTVGTLLAQRAAAAGIGEVVFDRGGNTYTGRIAALAEAAREGGLKF